VREALLSTNQRIVMVSHPGDGVTPPTNVVLLEQSPGKYVPVATGFGTAPIPALLTGGVAGIAVGTGLALGGDNITQNCSAASAGNSVISGPTGAGGPGGINEGIGSAAGGAGGSSTASGVAGAIAC
jgi:hypothetical protein